MYHRTYLNTPLDLEGRLGTQLLFVRLMVRQIMCDWMGVYNKFNNYSFKDVLSGAILRCSWFFYNSKNLNCFGAPSFLRSVHTISWILKSNWSSDVGHHLRKRWKSGWFRGVKLSDLVLKWYKKKMFEQKFNFSLVVFFCSHAAVWHWFLQFFHLIVF